MQYPLAAESGLAARMSERFSQVIVTLRYPDLKCLGAPNAHYRSATQGAEFHTHITSLYLSVFAEWPERRGYFTPIRSHSGNRIPTGPEDNDENADFTREGGVL